MSVPAYPEYRESGTQWLGQIPNQWASVPFGVLFRRTKRTGFAGEELLSVYRDYGVIRKSDRDDNFNNASEDLSTYQLVEAGDLAMNKMKAWQGSLGISPHRGIVSPAYFVFSPRRKFHPQFLHHLLRSPPYAAGYMTISKGIRINQWDVDPDHLSSLPVLFPTLDEQATIAAFLDRETAKIDALVAEQERLIALLKEKRQAVISHAVTKGLNPHAPMKDSGIEWLGEIPAHWEVVQLRRVLELQRGHDLPSDGRRSGEVPVVSSGGVIDTHDEAITSQPCIVTGRYGSIGKFNLIDVPCWPLNTALYTTRVAGVIRFQFYMLHNLAPLFEAFAAKSAVPGVDRNDLHPLHVCQPPIDEQMEISSYLDSLSKAFNKLTGEAQAAITLLQERRAALISAAVTGKIDVRGLVDAPATAELETI